MKRPGLLLSAVADAFDRRRTRATVHRLRKVYVEPTTRCNLRCPACMRGSWEEPAADMPMDTHDRLLDSLRSVRTARSLAYWGIGEPLVHPRIVEMIAGAHEIGLETELITNGQLLDDTAARGLVDAGLDRIVISIDGATPEGFSKVRPGADLGRTRKNVHSLHRARHERGMRAPEIAVEFVLMRRNLGQLRNLPELASELDARTVYLTNVLPYGEEFAKDILYALSAASEAFAIRFEQGDGFVFPRIDARPEILEVMNTLPVRASRDFRNPLILPSSYGSRCPFVERGAVAVRWDGAVSPCVELLHPHRVYVLGREKHVRQRVVGTLAEQTLKDIWRGNEYRKFRERVRRFEFSPCVGCGGCDMADSNEEDCIGSPSPTCGDCLWARGVVLCP